MATRPDPMALAAALGPPKGSPAGGDDAPMDDATASAQEVLDAIKADDAGALASAMRALVASVSDAG